MGAETTNPERELHAVWDGYLMIRDDEFTWTVLKFKDEKRVDGEAVRTAPTVEARHVVRRGKCDCKGFEHRLDCRHLKMVQHRHEAVDRKVARQAVWRLIARLETWPEIDRLVLEGYETDGEDDTLVRRAVVRAFGRGVEIEGTKYWKIFGLVKPNVLVEVRIEER